MDVVTGGAGFIGSHLVDRLLTEGKKVRVIDSLITGHLRNLEQHKQNPNLELIIEDIADVVAMDKATVGASRVFHLAARADIVPSIQNPLEYYHSNVDGTFAVLEAARKHQVQRLVYIASWSSQCQGSGCLETFFLHAKSVLFVLDRHDPVIAFGPIVKRARNTRARAVKKADRKSGR